MASVTVTGVRQSSDASEPNLSAELGKHYEIVDGQLVEEPALGAREVDIATTLTIILGHFVRTKKLGRMASEGLFILQKEPRLRRRPDLAYISRERWPLDRPIRPEAAYDVVPDLAVEIVSPSDLANEVQEKIDEYFEAGVRLVWVFYAAQAKVYIYESPMTVRILQRSDPIDGGSVLPGFQVSLAEIFETDADESFTPGDE